MAIATKRSPSVHNRQTNGEKPKDFQSGIYNFNFVQTIFKDYLFNILFVSYLIYTIKEYNNKIYIWYT